MTNRFIIADANKCIGCKTCELACVMSHSDGKDIILNNFQPRLKVITGMTVTVPVMCRQCDNAPCANACPTNAIIRKANSIQIIQERCIGCKTCVIACPFGAMNVVTSEKINNQSTGNEGYQTQAIKCDLCIDNPTGPACVNVCPTDTLSIVEPRNIDKLIQDKQKRTALEEINLFIQL
ncbi:4Fe-4S dicluster domain-containing protein [uncultured Gilliamella sp.]|uniref:4Fe-4S dicluster domain-containing protein n=1 Tax=uncultured Gilliamella sp. TaxID=1193505 RepID=UPI0025E63279|nr:4Fe-4S dicluster domain-containing protein [uncultured Gilliamella sp.]